MQTLQGTDWRRWFAWYPVRLSPRSPAWIPGGLKWLRWIERRRVYGGLFLSAYWWEYRRAERTNKSGLLGIAAVVGIVASFIAGVVLAFWLDDPRWMLLSLGAFILLYAG